MQVLLYQHNLSLYRVKLPVEGPESDFKFEFNFQIGRFRIKLPVEGPDSAEDIKSV